MFNEKFYLNFIVSLMVIIFACGTASVCNAGVNYSKLLNTVKSGVIKNKNTIKNARRGFALIYADNSELSIGGAEIGKSMNEIDDALGSSADQTGELDENGTMYHIYRNGKIGVISKDNIATDIFCEDRSLSTPRGIYVGYTFQDVIDAYGEEYHAESLDAFYNIIRYRVDFNESLVSKAVNIFSSSGDKCGQLFFVVEKYSHRVTCIGANFIEL